MSRLIVIASLLFAGAAHGADANPLAWMAGCWSTPDGNSVEVWRVDGDDLLGFAVTVEAGRVRFYETLSIRHGKNGYVYRAWPSKQRGTSFAADRIEPTAARFVNAEHDYPQAIEYRLAGDRLVADISMLDGTRERRFEKLRCEAIDAAPAAAQP